MADMMTRMRDLGRLFLRSAKETGESAAEMLEQRARIQRLAGQVRKLDRERSSLISQIGGKVYALHGQGKVRNQDVLTDCQRIDDIVVEIGSLKHEIEKIRIASMEKGIEIPVLSDEAPLTEEAEAPATPSAVHPAGTVGEQTLPEGGIPKVSEGREEYDELGEELVTEAGGPSQGQQEKRALAGQTEEPTEGAPK